MLENPILPGFNPDPCILAVDDSFYLVTSTFEWLPGLPIYKSKDLKHWQLIGHALTKESQLSLGGFDSALGIWAPALSFCKDNNKFYIAYSLVYGAENNNFDVDNFVVSSDIMEGEWSDPVYLNSSGFDPALFHDDDGKSWLINLEWDFRQGYEHPGCIVLQEWDRDKAQLTGDSLEISRGATDRGCLEGPQMYKKNGFYYLITAEGGTGYGHCIAIARSKQIQGPYTSYTENPIVTSQPENFNERGVRNSAKPHRYYPDSYLQKSGHGQIVETTSGEVYITHLCSRPLLPEQRSVLGRETAIQKCRWTADGWIERDGEDNMAQRFVPEPQLPSFPLPPLPDEDRFDCKEIPLHYYNPRGFIRSDWARLEGGRLKLRGRQTLFSRFNQSLLARRVTDLSFQAETRLSYRPESFLQMAGLVNYYNNRNFYYLRLYYSQTLGGPALGIMSCIDGVKEEYPDQRTALPREYDKIELKCNIEEKELQYSYRLSENDDWSLIGGILDASILSDEFAGGFTGSFTGITVQDLYRRESWAAFDYFRYKKQE